MSLRIFIIVLPSCDVLRNLIANPIQIPFVADNMLVIIALPYRSPDEGCEFVDFAHADRFEILDDGV